MKTKFDGARLIIHLLCGCGPVSIVLNALQADLPEILIADPTGGLSHISSPVEEVPFHGEEELTTAMMSAFIPVAMRSLIKVCLCLLCVVLHNLLYTATVALMPLMLIEAHGAHDHCL